LLPRCTLAIIVVDMLHCCRMRSNAVRAIRGGCCAYRWLVGGRRRGCWTDEDRKVLTWAGRVKMWCGRKRGSANALVVRPIEAGPHQPSPTPFHLDGRLKFLRKGTACPRVQRVESTTLPSDCLLPGSRIRHFRLDSGRCKRSALCQPRIIEPIRSVCAQPFSMGCTVFCKGRRAWRGV
jgi:hypothetical protein